MGADRSQTLDDWIIFLTGSDGDDVKLCLGLPTLIGFGLMVSLDESECVGLRLFVSWARIAS